MIGFCKNCKFWGKESTSIEFEGFHYCKALEEDSDIFWVSAYDVYNIMTKADFGCVLFQPKEV